MTIRRCVLLCTDVLLPRDPACPSRPVKCKLFLSPSIEERELVAGIGCLSNISKMGNMSIETKIRMGNIMIRPVASFGCQIWGSNFLELK